MYSWGDGDYGKLGHGGLDGTKLPRPVEKLQGVDIADVKCGDQFSVALTKDGKLYTWGSWPGNYGDESRTYPQVVKALKGK